MSEPFIVVENLWLPLGAFALREISFTLERGETLVILGPSGAGKSVLLETLAGFYAPQTGRIKIDARDVTRAPPEARRIGFMFQDYALFPHLTVAQNVQFASSFASSAARGQPRADEWLARLGLHPVAHRKPATLSGGEKQRVALARALAMQPNLFLFDEPLSALDAPMRDALREELKTLLHQFGLTAIYVTHDQAEALILADKIAVIHAGVFQQVGTPSEIFNTPVNQFVADFVGVETVLEGRIVAAGEGEVQIAVGDRNLFAVDLRSEKSNARVLACIRPEEVALTRAPTEGSSVRNQFRARVVTVTPIGPLFKIKVDAGFPLVAYVTKQSLLDLGLAPGASVVAQIKATAIHLIAG